MKEIFKEVNGFDGYFVSNKGVVKNIKILKSGKKSERIITIDPNKICVRLKDASGVYQAIRLANLVAEHFLEEPSNGRKKVGHKDGNEENNVATNLFWEGFNRDEIIKIQDMIDRGWTMGDLSRKFRTSRQHIRKARFSKVAE